MFAHRGSAPAARTRPVLVRRPSSVVVALVTWRPSLVLVVLVRRRRRRGSRRRASRQRASVGTVRASSTGSARVALRPRAFAGAPDLRARRRRRRACAPARASAAGCSAGVGAAGWAREREASASAAGLGAGVGVGSGRRSRRRARAWASGAGVGARRGGRSAASGAGGGGSGPEPGRPVQPRAAVSPRRRSRARGSGRVGVTRRGVGAARRGAAPGGRRTAPAGRDANHRHAGAAPVRRSRADAASGIASSTISFGKTMAAAPPSTASATVSARANINLMQLPLAAENPPTETYRQRRRETEGRTCWGASSSSWSARSWRLSVAPARRCVLGLQRRRRAQRHQQRRRPARGRAQRGARRVRGRAPERGGGGGAPRRATRPSRQRSRTATASAIQRLLPESPPLRVETPGRLRGRAGARERGRDDDLARRPRRPLGADHRVGAADAGSSPTGCTRARASRTPDELVFVGRADGRSTPPRSPTSPARPSSRRGTGRDGLDRRPRVSRDRRAARAGEHVDAGRGHAQLGDRLREAERARAPAGRPARLAAPDRLRRVPGGPLDRRRARAAGRRRALDRRRPARGARRRSAGATSSRSSDARSTRWRRSSRGGWRISRTSAAGCARRTPASATRSPSALDPEQLRRVIVESAVEATQADGGVVIARGRLVRRDRQRRRRAASGSTSS